MRPASPRRVLVVNAGSSSLKLRVLGGDGSAADDVTAAADLTAVGSALGGGTDTAAIRKAIGSFGRIDAVGHRVVHGGTLYSAPVLVTSEVRQRLESLTDLAPLHQPRSLAALDAISAALPGTPAVACFDTAFHASIPAAAATFALPAQWRARWELRRYGFHGLSHAYAARRAAQLAASGGNGDTGTDPGGSRAPDTMADAIGRAPEGNGDTGTDPGGSRAPDTMADAIGRAPGGTGGRPPGRELRVVSCHLGSGASLAAVKDGRSVDTTMGFTPLDGLVMATRSGSVDPGLVLWLAEHAGTPPRELAETLESRSGLTGLTGTGDMREVLARAAAGDARAILGRDVYLHRLRSYIASMAAAMDGLDVLVFTGGVGENSPEIRARAAAGLGFLGLRIDESRNTCGAADRGEADWEITAPGASVRTFVIAAREDRQIASEVRALLGGSPGG